MKKQQVRDATKTTREFMSRPIARGAAGTFGLKIANTGFLFLASLILARLLGPKGLGAYAYAMSWVAVLSILATLGFDRLLAREVAIYRTTSKWAPMRGLIRHALHASLAAAIMVCILAGGLARLWGSHFEPEMLSAFLVALLLVPLMTLNLIREGAMRGLQQVVLGQTPNLLLRPALFLLFLGLCFLIGAEALSGSVAVGLNVMATAFAFVGATRLLTRALPDEARAAMPSCQSRTWARQALPFLLLAGLQVASTNTDMLMLGTMLGAKPTGIYAVASRLAQFIGLALFAVNRPLGPAIASLYFTGDRSELQRLVTKSARAGLLSAIPVAIIFILFGRTILSLFGTEFVAGRMALTILSIGQFINVATGSVAVILVMTAHERDVVIGLGLSTVVNVLLNALLIPVWAIEGAAMATSAALILWNVLLMILVYRRLGINPTALGRSGIPQHEG